MGFVVSTAVADLRDAPLEIPHHDYSHQDERLSQCTLGESIKILREEGDWTLVAALEQLQYKKGWRGYQGWLHKSEIEESKSRSTYSFTKNVARSELVKGCELFLDALYLWGGCSPKVPGKIASVDCSGLIYQLFKRCGRLIPRDAHDQYLASTPVTTPAPGDLLFLRPLERPKKVTHVLFLCDPHHYIEAPETGKRVRLLSVGKDIWKERGVMRIFDRPKTYLYSYGRF